MPTPGLTQYFPPFNFYRTSLEKAKVDEVVDRLQDAYNTVVIEPLWVTDLTKKEQLTKRNLEETLPRVMNEMEKLLTSRGDYMVDDCLTWADIQVFYFCYEVRNMVDVGRWKKLNNLCKKVGEIPNIKQWVDSRPVTDL